MNGGFTENPATKKTSQFLSNHRVYEYRGRGSAKIHMASGSTRPQWNVWKKETTTQHTFTPRNLQAPKATSSSHKDSDKSSALQSARKVDTFSRKMQSKSRTTVRVILKSNTRHQKSPTAPLPRDLTKKRRVTPNTLFFIANPLWIRMGELIGTSKAWSVFNHTDFQVFDQFLVISRLDSLLASLPLCAIQPLQLHHLIAMFPSLAFSSCMQNI